MPGRKPGQRQLGDFLPLKWEPFGSRTGVPTRRVKDNMTMPGLRDSVTDRHFSRYEKSGHKFSETLANVHAAHRLSDKDIRNVFGVFESLTSEKTQRVNGATYRKHLGDVTASMWEPSLQTKSQHTRVTKAINHLARAFDENRELKPKEKKEVSRGVGIIANSSIKNIRGGYGPANMSIGAKFDQGVELTPGRKNVQNTPKSKGIRNAVERAEVAFRLEPGTMSDFRTEPRSSQFETGKIPYTLIQSPRPSRAASAPNAAAKTPSHLASPSHSTPPHRPTQVVSTSSGGTSSSGSVKARGSTIPRPSLPDSPKAPTHQAPSKRGTGNHSMGLRQNPKPVEKK